MYVWVNGAWQLVPQDDHCCPGYHPVEPESAGDYAEEVRAGTCSNAPIGPIGGNNP